MTPAFDPLRGLNSAPSGPYTRAVAVTPNDGAALPMMARALWVGTTGNIALVPRDNAGASVVIANVPVGELRIWTAQVLATGTTASNIIALA